MFNIPGEKKARKRKHVRYRLRRESESRDPNWDVLENHCPLFLLLFISFLFFFLGQILMAVVII